MGRYKNNIITSIVGRWRAFQSLTRTQRLHVVAALSVAVIVALLSNIDPKISFVVLAVLTSILLLLVWFIAGKVVFDTLIDIASTAGVVVSVIMFLASQYCDLPTEMRGANDSLKFVFAFGVLYALVLAYKAFTKNIDKTLETLKDPANKKTSIFMGLLLILIVAVFLWQLYAVASPIVQHLCIYRS